MDKVVREPFPALFPVPAVMVTSVLEGEKPNIITIAWTGILNSEPPMVYVSVRPSRYSHRLIKESGEFVVNIPSSDQVKVVDWCGTVSGKDIDKFKETGLSAVPARKVKAPLIKECPVNIECKVQQVVSLGSHDVFIAEVVTVHYSKDILTESGRLDFSLAKPYAYCNPEYRLVGVNIGSYGFTQKKS
ncbi:MAG: flavin reductase family protein [Bacillota bacterium]|uniref:flavin reductase family protein n=1 Tax=Desulforudis sp. DRI-14 TaxID=3459793 RepID=UPI003486FBC7